MNDQDHKLLVSTCLKVASGLVSNGNTAAALPELQRAVEVSELYGEGGRRTPAIELAQLVSLLESCAAAPNQSAETVALTRELVTRANRLLHARMPMK